MDCRSARTQKPEEDIMDQIIDINYVSYDKNNTLDVKNQHLKHKEKNNQYILLVE